MPENINREKEINRANERVKEWEKVVQLIEVVSEKGNKCDNPDQEALNRVVAQVCCDEILVLLGKPSD